MRAPGNAGGFCGIWSYNARCGNGGGHGVEVKVLVTGAAGFIGAVLCGRLLARGDAVVGFDNFNDYYDPALKEARVAHCCPSGEFRLVRGDLEDAGALQRVFSSEAPDRVVHLAAQAGVRYSLTHPERYIASNVVGFGNLLECCRRHPPEHLVYASSSSVYGASGRIPFSVHDGADHPISLYGATKKANEAMAHSYSHLYALPVTGLRFFTVYGPWGRPDMAYFSFTRRILAARPIDVFNHGRNRRDFTYIDDAVDALLRVLAKAPEPDRNWDPSAPDPGSSRAPYRLYNVGSGRPVSLDRFISVLEKRLGVEAKRNLVEAQPGDVESTGADLGRLSRELGYRPGTSLEMGLQRFVDWYRDYYTVG